jgi:hypothetical protein
MPERNEIEAALLDVRKGYRLIYLFQRRVLDVCTEIIGGFESDLNFYQWSPSHYEITPRRGTDPINRWAWDFLPLYDFCTFYLPEGVHWEEHKPGDWMLAIRVTADSGFAIVGEAEPDPRDFDEPVRCESCLRIYVYYCSKTFKANWYWGVFGENDFPPDGGERALSDGLRCFGMKFPLVDFRDRQGARTCVEEFKKRCRAVFPKVGRW